MAAIHVSQAEAEKNLHSLLAQLSADTSFLILNESRPVAVLQAAPQTLSSLSLEERIRLLPQDTDAVMDEDFARDVQAAVDLHREPLDSTLWDE